MRGGFTPNCFEFEITNVSIVKGTNALFGNRKLAEETEDIPTCADQSEKERVTSEYVA